MSAGGAAILRDEMLGNCLDVGLAPAPRPGFIGHMIRVAYARNAEWYRRLCESCPDATSSRRSSWLKRSDVLRVLDRIIADKPAGRVMLERLFPFIDEVGGTHHEQAPF